MVGWDEENARGMGKNGVIGLVRKLIDMTQRFERAKLEHEKQIREHMDEIKRLRRELKRR